APPQTVTLKNVGNAPGAFTLATSGLAPFSVSTDTVASGVLQPGQTWSVVADFTPTQAGPARFLGTISVDDPNKYYVCGAGSPSLQFSGEGVTEILSGWPTSPVDFGAVPCGATQGPPAQSFVLSNTGTLDAHLTGVGLAGAPGFGTDAIPGTLVP